MTQTIEKGISDIVGIFTDPIIVSPGGWGDTVPEWLKESITIERLLMNIQALRGEEPTGTDAEACAYLYTASLESPMAHDWAEIYLYVTTKVFRQWKSGDLPGDIVVEHINNVQTEDLARLKRWLYQRRIDARQDRDKAERREKKEAEAARRKEEQPALFEF